MKIQLLVFLLLICPSFQQNFSKSSAQKSHYSALEVTDSSIKWKNVCKLVMQLILSTDVAEKYRLDVIIHDLPLNHVSHKYNGFYAQLVKYSNERISMTIDDFKVDSTLKMDYVILLVYEAIKDYKNYIKNDFSVAYEDKSQKIIAIMSDYSSINNLKVLWSALVAEDYLNVYLISHTVNGSFNLYRTNLQMRSRGRTAFYTENVVDRKFISFKNRLPIEVRQAYELRIIFLNNFPISFITKDQIYGPEGNLINELTDKFGITYKIVNNPGTAISYLEINSMLEKISDICLYTNFILLRNSLNGVWLHEMDGLCLLIPRNIPVSSYENYTVPLDNTSMLLAFLSTVSLIVAWKVISMFTDIHRSISSILFSVYELVLNIGSSGLEELSSHENIMIYCFIFGSFILVAFYETIILSFMLTDSTMRSALNLQELNESSTKFHSFYDRNISQSGNLPMIRSELIMKEINILNLNNLEIPNNLNENLVYMVTCKYANSFLKSSNNFKGSRKLFDMLTLTQIYQRITTRSDFIYIDELRNLVERFEESGIYKLWEKDMVESYQQGFRTSNIIDGDLDFIEFKDMGLPLITLLIGCLMSLIVFLIEIFVRRCGERLSNKVQDVQLQSLQRPRTQKVNLTKWKERFILNKKLKLLNLEAANQRFNPKDVIMMTKQENFKCRESVKGGYFVLKKFKQKGSNLQNLQRNIQVHPMTFSST